MVAVKGRNVTAGCQGRFWSDEATVQTVLGPWAGPISVYANKTVVGGRVMRIDPSSTAIPAVAQSLTYDKKAKWPALRCIGLPRGTTKRAPMFTRPAGISLPANPARQPPLRQGSAS